MSLVRVAMDAGLNQLGFECIPTPTTSSAILIWEDCGEVKAMSTYLPQPAHHTRSNLAGEAHVRPRWHLYSQCYHVGSHQCWSHHVLWCVTMRAWFLLPVYEHRLLLTYPGPVADEHNLFSGSDLHCVGTSMGSIYISLGTSPLTHLHGFNGHGGTVPLYVRQRWRVQCNHLLHSGNPPKSQHLSACLPHPQDGEWRRMEWWMPSHVCSCRLH